MAFPIDRYSPHGYLHIPTHTRVLRPLGVVRSWDVGFRWHVPAFADGYGGQRETYRAGVRLAIDGAPELADLDEPISPYHSANLVTFSIGRGGGIHAEFHLVGEHALHGTAEVHGAAPIRLALHAGYRRLLGAGGEWGESGLVGRVEDGLLVLQGFEDGEAFVLWTTGGLLDVGITSEEPEARRWLAGPAPGLPAEGFVTVVGGRGSMVELHGTVGLPPGSRRHEWILARGRTFADARRHLDAARASAEEERRRLLAADEAFWAAAPHLSGDWPDHWRRGIVYDLETSRMMVRPPAGIYRHRWDGMQIQAPRVVLAETAMDALVLGYADPTLAQELLLGTFLDAPEPNVPCSREDGSYNMVAANGTVCGTAPSWGYPVWVAALLHGIAPDTGWLGRLYPPLADHVRWWLANRRDTDGFLIYACSWESGQDLSPRFGDQPLGGGQPIRHLRPVDLQAAGTQACRILAGFAATLGRASEAEGWRERALTLAARTAALWNGRRWADVDSRTGRPTTVDDVMLAAPLALGVASPDQAAIAGGGPWLDAYTADRLVWPMFAWTAAEALRGAGRADQAADVIGGVVDRAWRYWDAPRAESGRTLPGIAAEYWPLDGRCGGEGYGWGAFGVHLLLSTIVGLRPTPEAITVEPRLPVAWRSPGRTFGLEVTVHGCRRSIVLRPLGAEGLDLEIDGERRAARWGEPVRLAARAGLA